VTELKSQIRNDQNLLLIDVRSQQERDMYNIGGVLIPLHELPQQLNKIDRNKNIVIYCHTGARSLMAVKMLMEAGYTSARSLAGGVMAWQADEVELETIDA
jgi:adenylyltransferase/sulfurtransferase